MSQPFSPTRPLFGDCNKRGGRLTTIFQQEFNYTSMTRTRDMIRKATFAVFCFLLTAAVSQAATIVGQFTPLLTNQSSSNYSATPALFDTWAFQVKSDANWDSITLDLKSAGKFINDNDSINGTGDFTFKTKAADGSVTNPGAAANRTVESFMALPPATTPLAVNILDTANELRASWTTSPTTIQIPSTGLFTTIAMVSVPAGTVLNSSNFGGGSAVLLGGPETQITYVPEPATLSLLGLAFVGAFGYIRRR
jgi:PEP-CTERM motif